MPDISPYISALISSTISLIGCTFILYVYFKYKELQGPAYKLISILVSFDILHCITFMVPTYTEKSGSTLCICQAFTITSVTLASILWTSVISFFLYLTVVKKKSCEIYINKAFITCDILCVIASFIPLATTDIKDYAHNEGWCWIKNEGIRLLVLYIPLWMVVVFNTVIYMIVIKHIRIESTLHPELYCIGQSMIRKLKMYPIILIVSFLPSTSLRVLQFFSNEPHENFVIVASVFICLHGFFNSIVYGLTKNVRSTLLGQSAYSSKYSDYSSSDQGISLFSS
ncbi:hypothetical protein SteCoe_13576 [Stentor coeruleus]|uniref:G-protein coupled receptors family 2 profile 2 domain-containing protein n=1 Tax=Stentor coeruleus TaxID=5963 RepID=A0A1R2C866_9CILI|nr:hypothetical protein SteCoe_13576 [Stentor coeruleus]